MAKRKRSAVAVSEPAPEPIPTKKSKATDAERCKPSTSAPTPVPAAAETIQIITGSYDRVLHGFTITIAPTSSPEFADTFLFNAHASAIRCVAVSPPTAAAPSSTTQKVLLASGSTDERIQVYSLSAHPPSRRNQSIAAGVAPRPILENAKNRELGTLLHHSSTVTALSFASRSKLLSASDDSSVAVTRTRDWSVLSTIKAPKATMQGRPSGDTAAFGGAPSGVNDFAVHPSMKLMISVSKGERCMRLWNLVTGKKAGVLSFGREMLQKVGEGRYATGEARRVVWGSSGGADEFAVGFDRGIVVYGMDSVPRCRVMGGMKAKVKIHQFGYLTLDVEGEGKEEGLTVLAVATEDGRIAFFSTRADDLTTPTEDDDTKKEDGEEEKKKKKMKKGTEASIPVAKLVAEVGGQADGVAGRIKDFVFVKSTTSPDVLYVVGASSDGRVRVWNVSRGDLRRRVVTEEAGEAGEGGPGSKVGKLVGTYETHNRVTCMAGYLMLARPEGMEESEDELDEEEDEDDEDDSGSDDE